MKYPKLALLMLCVIFSSCVVRVIDPEPVRPGVIVVTPAPRVVMVNQRLGLLAYPNSRLLKVDNQKAEFESNASLDQVYAYFHNELARRNWLRTELSFKNSASKLQARYQRQNERFELKLDQQGKSNRYKLEIKF